MCNKIPLAVFLLVLVIGAAVADLFMVLERKEEIVKPKPMEKAIVSGPPDNEPYLAKPLKLWKKKEIHPCYPGQADCGTIFRVNGEVVDYWQWKLEQEIGE